MRRSMNHQIGNNLPSDFTICFYYLSNIMFPHEIQVPFVFDYWFINVEHHVRATYDNSFLLLQSEKDVVENTEI